MKGDEVVVGLLNVVRDYLLFFVSLGFLHVLLFMLLFSSASVLMVVSELTPEYGATLSESAIQFVVDVVERFGFEDGEVLPYLFRAFLYYISLSSVVLSLLAKIFSFFKHSRIKNNQPEGQEKKIFTPPHFLGWKVIWKVLAISALVQAAAGSILIFVIEDEDALMFTIISVVSIHGLALLAYVNYWFCCIVINFVFQSLFSKISTKT